MGCYLTNHELLTNACFMPKIVTEDCRRNRVPLHPRDKLIVAGRGFFSRVAGFVAGRGFLTKIAGFFAGFFSRVLIS